MAPVDSTVLATAGFGGDVFRAGLRGFFAALPVLRLALAVLVTFFRARFFVALLFVLLFLAINASSSWCGLLDHIAHRRPLSAMVPIPGPGEVDPHRLRGFVADRDEARGSRPIRESAVFS